MKQKFKVITKPYRGSPVIEHMNIAKEESKVAYIQLSRRYFGVDAFGMNVNETDVPSVCISKGSQDKNTTCIEFPAFKGYQIITASIFKYTLVVCFLKLKGCSKKLTKKQLDSKAHELFPMFQVMPNEGIEDVIDRVVPELRKLTKH